MTTLRQKSKRLLKKAEEKKLILFAASVFIAFEALLPYFSERIPHGIFAFLSAISVAASFIARTIAVSEFEK